MHYMPVNQRIRKALLNPAWVCFTWLGMTIGVSLIATPVRFAAESITRPVALDVGRVVFAALNKAELMALVLLLILVRVSGRSRDLWAWCGALALILVAQGAWLIPELAARTDIILAGSEPPPSQAHAIYSTLDLAKMAALLFLGARSLAERA
jgi:hypothetical protein